jgi:hypothetical protein
VECDGKSDVDMESGDEERSYDRVMRIVRAKKEKMSSYIEKSKADRNRNMTSLAAAAATILASGDRVASPE